MRPDCLDKSSVSKCKRAAIAVLQACTFAGLTWSPAGVSLHDAGQDCVRGQQTAAQQCQGMPHANKLSHLVAVAAACKGAASGAGQLRTAAPAKQGHALANLHLVEPPAAGSMAAQGHPELPAQHATLLNNWLLPKHLGSP